MCECGTERQVLWWTWQCYVYSWTWLKVFSNLNYWFCFSTEEVIERRGDYKIGFTPFLDSDKYYKKKNIS